LPGIDDYTGGDLNKIYAKKHRSVKSEANTVAFGMGG